MNQILSLGISPATPNWAECTALGLSELMRAGMINRLALVGNNGTSLQLENYLRANGLIDRVTASFDPCHAAYDSFHLHEGFLFRDQADFYVLCVPPTDYRSKLRLIADVAERNCGIILPFSSTPSASHNDQEASRKNREPIVVSCFPCAGTNRFAIPMQDLLNKYEWKRAATRSLQNNACFANRTKDMNLTELLLALDQHILTEIKGLEFYEFGYVHDPISMNLMKEVPHVRVLMLLRDPRDIIVSYYHRMYGAKSNVSDGLYLDELREELKEERLIEIFSGGIFQRIPSYVCPWPPLKKFCVDFVEGARLPNVLPVKFEDLHSRPRETYRHILNWLGMNSDIFTAPLSDDELDKSIYLGSFEAQTNGARKRGEEAKHVVMQGGLQTSCRKGVPGDWRIHFSEKVKNRCKELIGQELIELGYETDLNW